MITTADLDRANAGPGSAWLGMVSPRAFSLSDAIGTDAYLADPSALKLVEFFEAKGLAAIKDEDRREQWYDDWLSYQARHRLYATVLSPRRFSTIGGGLDLLRLTRFLEVFAYFSPAHGYSLQVSFLGLFSILMGPNDALKREAVAALEAGGLFAFGVSEKDHGSDLLGNEFSVRDAGPGRLVANGAKYYIGNANCAAMISVLARKDGRRSAGRDIDAGRGKPVDRDKRAPVVLVAIRPDAAGFGGARKIHTLGVRAAFVGEFSVSNYDLPETDLIADGRRAWDAVFGTVTLGKFFLGFGSVGICEHAFTETAAHLTRRLLYGKPVIELPHIRSAMAAAYARLAAMKLYAFRALDYVHAAAAADRRYVLFCAVQKAKISTEGVKVMALLAECAGAKGFEGDTYLEMALRDAQLIPAVEGSTHINLGLAAQFLPRYFGRPEANLAEPRSLVAGEEDSSKENAYLIEARTGSIPSIGFSYFLDAYGPLLRVPNVRIFVKQVKALRVFLFVRGRSTRGRAVDSETPLALGQCLATVAYGQLIAENAARLGAPTPLVSAMFHTIINDLSVAAIALASSCRLDAVGKALVRRMIVPPRTSCEEWDFVAECVKELEKGAACGSTPAPAGGNGDKASDHQ